MPKETGIIMSGSHPVDILEGRKTMTRRVINPQPIKGAWNATAEHPSYGWFWKDIYQTWEGEDDFFKRLVKRCPFGGVGDQLWVKETYALRADGLQVLPKAGYEEIRKALDLPDFNIKWKSSLFMPRWGSRILLEITEVRVERLQEITISDIESEGHQPFVYPDGMQELSSAEALSWYQHLWDSLNAKRGYGWEKTPWVWVISFKIIKQ